MMLNENIVNDAISSGRPIKTMYRTGNRFFNDYRIIDYVLSDQIPNSKYSDNKRKISVEDFFNEYEYKYELNFIELLQKKSEDHVKEFYKAKVFPYEFTVHAFSTFFVIEIQPNTTKTEYLLIEPIRNTDGVPEFMKDMQNSIAITSILAAISDDFMGEVALNMKIDSLLEYLRSGRNRKTKFIFFYI